jgi:hypothetical protein
VELCKDARRVEACFGGEFVRRVGAGGEEGGETRDGGGVRCTCAAHDYRKDVYHCARPVAADGVCKGCVFGTYEVSCLGEVVVRAVLPFPYLNLFYRCVTAAIVCVKPRFVLEEDSPVEDSGIPYSLRFYADSGWRLGPNSYFTGKILCKLLRVLSYVLFENHMNFK